MLVELIDFVDGFVMMVGNGLVVVMNGCVIYLYVVNCLM